MNYHDVMENVKRKANEMLIKQKPVEVIQFDPQAEAMKQAYRDLFVMPAWKDIEKLFEEVKNSPLQFLDEKTIAEVTLADAGYIKGVRSAIKTIQQKILAKIK